MRKQKFSWKGVKLTSLQRLLLYAILNFLITLTVPLYHIVEQQILEQNI